MLCERCSDLYHLSKRIPHHFLYFFISLLTLYSNYNKHLMKSKHFLKKKKYLCTNYFSLIPKGIHFSPFHSSYSLNKFSKELLHPSSRTRLSDRQILLITLT